MTTTTLPLPTQPALFMPSPGEHLLLADLTLLGLGRIELSMVDAATAAEWLTHNTHNRNLKPAAISRFATDLLAGVWQWTGEPIRFANDGTLIDGQNRLHAIVDSDSRVPLLVIRDLHRDAQDAIDTGTPRKLHDILKLRGENNASSLAALLRIIVAWETGSRRATGNNTIPHSACIRMLADHPDIRDLVNPSRSVGDNCGLPASVVGLVWWITSRVDAEDAEFFFQRLGDGQGLVKGDPIYELRRTAQESRNLRGERNRTWLLAITIKAWNAYRRGESVGLYRWRPGGANPEKFPEPV